MLCVKAKQGKGRYDSVKDSLGVTTRCGVIQLLSPGQNEWVGLKGPALQGTASKEGKGAWCDPGIWGMKEKNLKQSGQARTFRY